MSLEGLIIRPLLSQEHSILREFLYLAIFLEDGNSNLPMNIVDEPSLIKYIKEFEKKDDICLVAEVNSEIIGAIWTRLFDDEHKGYGYYDDTTPELSMSVKEEFRGNRVGNMLLSSMKELLKEQSYKQVSLSVSKNNFATNLYIKFGFIIIEEREKDYLMLVNL
ncbi:GNAT family N-acetyltransferase [Clostridium estertheticum]|uniref:GNAT family N-acetyltransferase n=1 Tax=Clostridium estertheticum TaxID=238834 RepID=UPI001C6E31A7|nr:GNAT family N-acetyltransferase [Clostridium estertheticum]MBW9153873.1 GNAT family N-acetyltransferase [Clostridium estertheticum]WLC86491.1 GNAT family N-acetyltransferase [Clostridium estertheticum]